MEPQSKSQICLTSFLNKYSSALRVKETILLIGFFLIGAIFSIEKLSMVNLFDLSIIATLAFLLNSSLYALNAFTGIVEDKHNNRLIKLAKAPGSFYLYYFLFSLVLTLIASWFFDMYFLRGIIVLFILGVVYSLPILKLKNGPIGGTIVHFFYQVIAFNSAYAVFDNTSWTSLLISIYFALLFSAGHLHHQAIDYEADKLANLRTSAVKWGLKMSSKASFILAGFSALYWALLYYYEFLDLVTMILFIIAFCLQMTLYIFYKNKFEDSNISRVRYRNYYRLCYLMAGFCLILLKL